MSPRINYILIGLFIVAGAAGFLALSFWIGGAEYTQDRRAVVMVFRDSVSGLSEGSSVRFMGVTVGSVQSISLVANGEPAVKVRARVRENTPISPATRAALAFEGLTGVTYVNLEERAGAPAVEYDLEEEDALQIATVSAGLLSLSEQLPNLADDLSDTLERAQRLLSEENLAHVTDTLAAIDNIASALDEQRPNIQRALSATGDVMNDIGQAAEDLRDLIQGAGPGMEQGINSLAELAQQLETWLERHEGSLDDFVEEGLARTGPAMRDLSDALEELQRLARELRRDPSRAIYQDQEDAIVLEP